MIIYLLGMSCVGATTIGRMLAEKIGFTFFDMASKIEAFYQKPIERIQDECLTMQEYWRRAAIVLDHVFSKNLDCVVSGTPAGLKHSYWQVYKNHKTNKELYSIHLFDTFENVLNRLTFYDKDSKPIVVPIDESNRDRYLYEIKADYRYFESSYKRADVQMDIEHLKLEDIPDAIIGKLRVHHILPLAPAQVQVLQT